MMNVCREHCLSCIVLIDGDGCDRSGKIEGKQR